MSVTLLQIDSSSLFLDGIEPFLGHQFSMTKATERRSSNFDLLLWQRNLGYFCKNFKLLLFCFLMESSHFWPLVLREPFYKTLFDSIFDLGPLTPKIWPKIAYNSACMADTPEMFAHNRGFQGWPIQWNHTKCCRADPCCHGNEIWAKIAYNSTCTVDRPKMFRPSRGFSADSMQPCKILYGWPLLPWQRHLR